MVKKQPSVRCETAGAQAALRVRKFLAGGAALLDRAFAAFAALPDDSDLAARRRKRRALAFNDAADGCKVMEGSINFG